MDIFKNNDKKVEYIELIYDLIFVYIIGRNNSILVDADGGFLNVQSVAAYLLCTLAVIQIWNYTTFYINMFGRNSIRDHVFLFINMYLLYFVGESTRPEWQSYQTQYHVAWGLILVNIAIQFLIELRNHRDRDWNADIIKRMAGMLFVEAAVVFAAAVPVPELALPLSAAAIGISMVLTVFHRKRSPGEQIDFKHMSERAMLFVVFTFGEMIITVASYFAGDGSWDWSVIYFSAMTFIIVVALFLSYEVIYNHMIDRDGDHDGLSYLVIHIFIIFCMNNITASLEFMRRADIALLPKIAFLLASMIGYFAFLLCLYRFTKKKCRPGRRLLLTAAAATAVFAVTMLIFRGQMQINILISVLYVFFMFLLIYKLGKGDMKQGC